jgi:hypothetical protein
MKVEPTLNEMCEYVENNKPKGYGHSINSYTPEKDTDMFVHTPDEGMFRMTFSSLRNLVEFLFNYYFAVNNKS